jgi:hypothetical protein
MVVWKGLKKVDSLVVLTVVLSVDWMVDWMDVSLVDTWVGMKAVQMARKMVALSE